MTRLARPLYESIPGAYGTLGVALLGASYYWRDEWWSSISAVAGLVAVVVGLVLWMHRRDYRAMSADYQRRGRSLLESNEDQR